MESFGKDEKNKTKENNNIKGNDLKENDKKAENDKSEEKCDEEEENDKEEEKADINKNEINIKEKKIENKNKYEKKDDNSNETLNEIIPFENYSYNSNEINELIGRRSLKAEYMPSAINLNSPIKINSGINNVNNIASLQFSLSDENQLEVDKSGLGKFFHDKEKMEDIIENQKKLIIGFKTAYEKEREEKYKEREEKYKERQEKEEWKRKYYSLLEKLNIQGENEIRNEQTSEINRNKKEKKEIEEQEQIKKEKEKENEEKEKDDKKGKEEEKTENEKIEDKNE